MHFSLKIQVFVNTIFFHFLMQVKLITRCGGNTLLPYMPVRCKGRVCVCVKLKCILSFGILSLFK